MFRQLSDLYGWSAEEIGRMTLAQTVMFLAGPDKRKVPEDIKQLFRRRRKERGAG